MTPLHSSCPLGYQCGGTGFLRCLAQVLFAEIHYLATSMLINVQQSFDLCTIMYLSKPQAHENGMLTYKKWVLKKIHYIYSKICDDKQLKTVNLSCAGWPVLSSLMLLFHLCLSTSLSIWLFPPFSGLFLPLVLTLFSTFTGFHPVSQFLCTSVFIIVTTTRVSFPVSKFPLGTTKGEKQF